MAWSFHERAPVYVQIADRLRNAILKGEYSPGEQIPPVRQLAVTAAVNPNTVQRAVGELEAEGILVSRTTQGCYVTEDAAVLARAQQNAAKKLIADFVRQAGELSLDRDTVIHMLQEEMTDECTGM